MVPQFFLIAAAEVLHRVGIDTEIKCDFAKSRYWLLLVMWQPATSVSLPCTHVQAIGSVCQSICPVKNIKSLDLLG